MSEILTLKKSNCKNCYKCIRHCPVKSIRFSGNQAHIVQNECILCGKCFVVCPQNAKQVASSIEKVKVMISSGEKVVASVAPSFAANYGVTISEVDQALKKLGFYGAKETAEGAQLVKNEYLRILREEKPDVLISSCCHSVNLLIEKYYPAALSALAKVVSPMVANCREIKKSIPGAKTVFIGPCVSKKDEGEKNSDSVDAVLTFEEISEWLESAGIKLSRSDSGSVFHEKSQGEGVSRLFPVTGGIIDSMTDRPAEYTYIVVDGADNCRSALEDVSEGRIHNCFIEMSMCSGSCIGGPVMDRHYRLSLASRMAVENFAGDRDFAQVKAVVPEEMKKEFALPLKDKISPSEQEIDAVLKQMGKTKPEDMLNCGSCGYNTCREKAIAIIEGKADISMCLPYLKEKAESFSDNIINNTPNGILVLNDKLEVQKLNRAAAKIMKIKNPSDLMGEPVVRILDPKPFIDVSLSGKNIYNRGTYLADYKKYVSQTILFDREYHIYICIMRDVTEEEEEKEKKEEVARSTVEIADKVVEKQMRIVQEIASLLGETAAETKIALTKLKESITNE